MWDAFDPLKRNRNANPDEIQQLQDALDQVPETVNCELSNIRPITLQLSPSVQLVTFARKPEITRGGTSYPSPSL